MVTPAGTLGALLAAVLAVGVVAAPPVAAADGPSEAVRAVVIPGTGSLVAVDGRAMGVDQVTWNLDLRDHHWTRLVDGPPNLASLNRLAHVPGRDEVLSIPLSPGAVWSLDLDEGSWSPRTVPEVRPTGVTDIAVDTRRRVVLAWSDTDDCLWAYDPAANRWSAIARTVPWPSAELPEGQRGYTLMAYDSHADRLVLAVLPVPGRPGSTWLLDPSTGRWSRRASRPPALMLGYGEWGTEAVYDPVHRRTVLLGRGTLATYDSRRDRWQVADQVMWPAVSYGPREPLSLDGVNPWPLGIPLGPLARDAPQLVVDDVSGRIVVLGGTALFRTIGADAPWALEWHPVREVWAYDVGFNSWTLVTGGQGRRDQVASRSTAMS